MLLTSGSLAALGLTPLLASVVPAAVALGVLLVGAAGVVWLLVAGDVVPAVLYLPTLMLGIALLTGWADAVG